MSNVSPKEIVPQFKVPAKIAGIHRFDRGIINDTYIVTCIDEDEDKRFILQRINGEVFEKPDEVMSNIRVVTEHLRKGAEAKDRVLKLVRTHNNENSLIDSNDSVWRMYNFIENSTTFDTLLSVNMAYQVGTAFGAFQGELAGIEATSLHKTIDGFHNTSKRLTRFKEVLAEDPRGRAKKCEKEIEYILENQHIAPVLMDLERTQELPTRITHNDTKVNNVLFDQDTHQALCVIDLDTIMPGISLFDYGDLVRSATCPSAEDERDLSRVYMQMDYYKALTRGWIEACKGEITEKELELMPFSARLIAYELAMRFLRDYLNGDQYFKTSRPDQNLDRARTQIKMAQSFEENEAEMKEYIASITA